MAGTKAGGLKTAKINKELHGGDFYKRIGRRGGKASGKGGFAANPALARLAGAKGGSISRRGGNKKTHETIKNKGEELKALYDMGVPMTTIADKYNINYHILREWLVENV